MIFPTRWWLTVLAWCWVVTTVLGWGSVQRQYLIRRRTRYSTIFPSRLHGGLRATSPVSISKPGLLHRPLFSTPNTNFHLDSEERKIDVFLSFGGDQPLNDIEADGADQEVARDASFDYRDDAQSVLHNTTSNRLILLDCSEEGRGRHEAAKGRSQSLPLGSETRLFSTEDDDKDGLGGFDPMKKVKVGTPEKLNVGNPQQLLVKEKERSVTSILKELAAIQQQGPQKYCILGTRHCSFLHQQIIELLAYALVLSGNHVYTSGAGGTHAATIRGALRAERPDLLTVVLPQSMDRQPLESQELLRKVDDVVSMPQNDELPLDLASRICNSVLINQTDQLISFAFHESTTVIEAVKEAKKLDKLVTVLYLD